MLQFSPNLIATADINPFAIVKMSTTAFSGSASTAAADYVVGVADGSTRRFDASVHAAAGDPISLQPSNCVQLKCGGTAVTAGLGLIAGTAGVAVTAAGTGNVPLFVALEPADVGTIFWAYRLPSVKPL